MSPTNSESPLSTAHGSSPRARSISANAVCSGRWPGVCSARSDDVAERQLPAVVERLVLVVGRGEAVDVDRRAGGERQPAVARDVVGVVVGLEDVLDAHAHVPCEVEVHVDLEARIDDRRDARASTSPTRYDAQPRSSWVTCRNSMRAKIQRRAAAERAGDV